MLKQANHQIEQLLEVYWVVQPYNGHYREEKSTLEARLSAVKNDKIYHQLIESGFTCTVCAQRDALCMEPFDQYETIYELKNKVKILGSIEMKSLKEPMKEKMTVESAITSIYAAFV